MTRHELIFQIIRETAEALGLPEGRVLTLGKDNLTVPRPRIELQFMGETYTSAVRGLAVTRLKDEREHYQELKKQLYTVREQVGVNVLAEDEAWLQTFCRDLIACLPRGVNDADGNWIKIRAESAEEPSEPEKRVGLETIKVFTRVSKFLTVTFEGRVTVTEESGLMEHVEIKPPSYRQGA